MEKINHEPEYFAWIVRLLTYHGMRSGEASARQGSQMDNALAHERGRG
jgi:hypothetical protein